MQENFPHPPGSDSKKPPVLGAEPQKWPTGHCHEEGMRNIEDAGRSQTVPSPGQEVGAPRLTHHLQGCLQESAAGVLVVQLLSPGGKN